MAGAGKVILVGGVIAAAVAVAVLAAPKKAKAAPGTVPLPPGARPEDIPPVAPPLSGTPVPEPGQGVVVVPDDGEPEEDEVPVVVAPSPVPASPVPLPVPVVPPFVPPASPPKAPPASLPIPADVLDAGKDILEQAGIPMVVPPVIATEGEPSIELPELVVTPTQEQAEQPTALHDDTAAVLSVMLPAEATAKWKRVEAALKPWQRARQLKEDGKFGPKSALTMAAETGLLPIIRYWPAGAQPGKAVPEFRAALIALANDAAEPRATQLRAAAEREQGQGFGSNQKPISPLIALT